MGWQDVVAKTVTGLGYDLVDCERSARGLLVVYIDRLPGRTYLTGESEVVTVDDCEQVTRQLQRVLEVEGCAYERLEVSSPGVDRPLRREADYERFAGEQVDLQLKVPFQGRRKYRGVLRKAEPSVEAPGAEAAPMFELVFNDGQADQVLGFSLDEVREARLVPVLDFKGRKRGQGTALAAASPQAPGQPGNGVAEAAKSGGHKE